MCQQLLCTTPNRPASFISTIKQFSLHDLHNKTARLAFKKRHRRLRNSTPMYRHDPTVIMMNAMPSEKFKVCSSHDQTMSLGKEEEKQKH